MQSAASGAPRKKYVRSNICVLCGLSFIQTEITREGVEIYCKQLMKTKLRLSNERVLMIQRVIEQFVLPEDGTTDGVCIKCYRHVESVIKLETQKENLKKQIIESWRKEHTLMLTPSSKITRRVTQKRLLRSPGVSLPPSKEIRVFPGITTNLIPKQPMQLATFDGIAQAATTGQPITATSSYSSTCTDILIPVTKVHVVPPGKEIIFYSLMK